MTPLHGKYLVRHRLLNAALRSVDALLSLAVRTRPTIPRPGSILVANIAHLGDALLSTGVLAALRTAFPDVRIGFLAGSWSCPVLHDHPLLERLHTFDHVRLNRSAPSLARQLSRHFTTRRQAIAEIRAARYDVAIDLYPYFPNAIPLLWAAGVPVRIGYRSGGFGPLLTHALDWHLEDAHVTQYHARLLELLPLPTALSTPLSPILPEDDPTIPIALPRSYVVLHPGAGAAFKEWPSENWRAVLRALVHAGQAIVLTGNGTQEQATCAALAREVPVIDLCGKLSWRAFVAVVHRARLLLGVDSVAGHVAAAVGTPCIVLATGIPHPAHWKPLGSRVRVLRQPTACAPCYRSRGCAGMECLRGIAVAEVLAAIGTFLAEDADRAA